MKTEICSICSKTVEWGFNHKCYEIDSAFDPVQRPHHYNQGKAQCKSCGHPIECIDITRHMDFAIGNAMKYLWRFREKNGLQDLAKARWYLDDAIKQLEKVKE